MADARSLLLSPTIQAILGNNTRIPVQSQYNPAGFSDVGYIGGRAIATPGPGDDITGILDLARGLVSTPIDLPQQQIAGFSPDQQRAFALARQGVGSYQPYLNQAAALTNQAARGIGQNISATQALASQVPGQVRGGQQALGQAAQSLGQATAGARGLASLGQYGADIAAQRARMSTAEAQRALQDASQFGLGAAQQGISGLAGSAAMYNPAMAGGFMNAYEDAAVQQALSDIARQGALQQQQNRAQAVSAGAFGGSRQGVLEAETARNILEQQGRTAAQMRAAGFESASERAQSAFEQALARQQQAAQLTGQLGQMGSGSAASAAQAAGQLGLSAEDLAQKGALQGAQLGMSGEQLAASNAQAAGDLGLQSANLGLAGIQAGLGAQQQAAGLNQGLASLGAQQLGLGQARQQMGLQDVNTMLGIGGQQQQLAQGQLDVNYQNQYARAMQPYQQLAYYSDIAQGAPSGQSSVTQMPGPSVGSQILGMGMAIPAIYSGFKDMMG